GARPRHGARRWRNGAGSRADVARSGRSALPGLALRGFPAWFAPTARPVGPRYSFAPVVERCAPDVAGPAPEPRRARRPARLPTPSDRPVAARVASAVVPIAARAPAALAGVAGQPIVVPGYWL